MLQISRWAETGSVSIVLYLFGADAPAVAAREQATWDAWGDRVLRSGPARAGADAGRGR